MELVKKNIHMDRTKAVASAQITLGDDINISDSRPDAERLVCEKGSVILEEVRAVEDHVIVKGRLSFMVMYLSETAAPCSMEGALPFEEQVYMEGVRSGEGISSRCLLEDLTVGLINSRKLSVQALVSIALSSEVIYDEEPAVELYHEVPVEYRKKPLRIAGMTVRKRDILRIREEVALSQNQPNIARILWQSIEPAGVVFKAQEGGLSVHGELKVFFLYESEGEEPAVCIQEAVLPFHGRVECSGCDEGMAEDVTYTFTHKEVEIRPDFDGEQRLFALEVIMDMDIRLYAEERLEILSGVYGVTQEIETAGRPAVFKSLVARAEGRAKCTGRLKAGADAPAVMQILHSEVQVQPEQEEVTENGLRISGSLVWNCLYQSTDQKQPYASLRDILPFSCELETPALPEDCLFRIQAEAEQPSVSVLDHREADVRTVVSCRALIFEQKEEEIITDMTISDLDMNKLNDLPGMVIYIVKEGDSLWDIGKRYYVPISSLRETNGLTSEEIRPGDKLLVVKGIND